MQEVTLSNGHSAVARKPRKAKEAKAPKAAIVSQPVNLSGIRPTEFNVVVLADEAEDTIQHGSLTLIKPADLQQKESQASQSGTLVAVSPLAFSYERWPDGAMPPQVGQKVLFTKYAGMKRKGKDGREYVVMKDKDLAAILD